MNFKINLKKYSYDPSKVVVIDPNDFDNIFIFEDKKIRKKDEKETIKKEALISTYLPARNVISYELEIPKNLIGKIDLYSYIETKCYEELDLDEAEKYVFKYKLVHSITNEKNMIAEIIIAQQSTALIEYFTPLYEKYNFIDYIGYSGFLFEVLYKKKLLEARKDIFIFFTKNNILITLYADGEFLQNIILKDGLYSIYEKLENSHLVIDDLDYELFLEILIKKGLDPENYDYAEEPLFNQIGEIFSDLFMIIINQLNALKRKFSLSTIDRLFISTEEGNIPGIIDFTNIYLGGIIVKELKFDSKFNPDKIKINQLIFLTILSASYAYENNYHDFNFTIKKRPPTFFYRKSGQLISISVASFILASAYPFYEYIDYLVKSNQNEELKIKLNKLNNKYNRLNSILNNRIKLYKQKKEIAKKKEIYIKSVEEIIYKLYNEKINYNPISTLIANITYYMKQNSVYLQNLEYNKGILSLYVFAKKAKYITNLVNQLVKNKNYILETNGITKDKNYYISQIDIKVN